MRHSDAGGKLVFICSRYAGEVDRNVEIAKSLCRMAVEAGCVPFAPHLYFTQFLDDGDPEQRALGISLGLRVMALCDEVWFYVGDGVSDGMARELAHAGMIGKRIVEIRGVR